MKREVTPDMLAALAEELEAAPRAAATTTSPVLAKASAPAPAKVMVPETPQERDKLLSALEVISPDAMRGSGTAFEPSGEPSDSSWLAVVWAIRSLNWASGESIAREWSMRSARYDEDGFDKAWDSYDPNHPRPVGIGTLYKLAKAMGWTPPGPATAQIPPVEEDGPRYTLLSPSEVAGRPRVKPRIKGVLPTKGLGAIYGPSGSGKTFLATDMGAAIAEGSQWFGKRTVQAPVVYVMLEGEAGLGNRMAAWEKANGRPFPEDFRSVLQPFRLTNFVNVQYLAEAIPPEAVVIIDTLNRAAPTADENSSQDMGEIIEAAKELQRSCDGLVLMVHHTGKDVSRGLRGHSSLHAALDCAIQVDRTATGRAWSVAKSKDGADGLKVDFDLQVHQLGVDEDGDPIESCTIGPCVANLFVPKEPQGKGQKAALKAIRQAIGASSVTGKAGCGASARCLTRDDAIDAIANTLPTYAADKRRNRAQKLLTDLVDGGHLLAGIQGNEGWLWLP